MDIRKILTWSLGAFVLAGLAVFALQEYRLANAVPAEPVAISAADPGLAATPAPAAAGPGAATAPKPAEEKRLQVMYLHGAARCRTCLRIESLTRQALEQGMPGEVEAGEIEWSSVDTDLPKNAHLLQKYQLHTKSVVVSERLGNRELRWKNLDRVWDLVGDDAAFKGYIQTEVRAWMTGAK
jgi:hypothetical protein